MKKNLLIIATETITSPHTGVAIPIAQTINALSEAWNCHLVVISPNQQLKKSDHPLIRSEHHITIRESKILKYIFSAKPHFVYTPRSLKKHLLPLIERIKPDLIHVDLLPLAETYAAIGKATKAPLILSLNDSLELAFKNHILNRSFPLSQRLFEIPVFLKTKLYERSVIKNYQATRLVSQFDANHIRSNTPAKVACISNSIDTAKYEYKPISNRNKSILFIGLAGPQIEKKIVDLIHQLAQPAPQFDFKIIGRGYSTSFEEFCKGFPWVNFIGPVQSTIEHYQSASLFINPNDKECGVYNKYLEAMSCGTPCMGPRQSYNAFYGNDFAENEHALTLKETTTSKEIEEIINNTKKLSTIAKKARLYVEKNFSTEAQKEAIITLYNGTLQNHQ